MFAIGHLRCIALLMVLWAAYGLAWAIDASADELVFVADYESRALNAGVEGVGAHRPAAADALQVDCGVARSGACSIRSTVAPGTEYVSADAFRAESDAMKLLPARYSAGDRFVYRFSLRLAGDWTFDSPSAIDIVWQFKRFSRAPDMFVAIKGQALVLRVGKSKQLTLLPAMPRGEWVDVKFMVRWSDAQAGLVEGQIYRAGQPLGKPVRFAGANMWNAQPQAGYLKWGLYKPGKLDGTMTFARRSVWHDDIEVTRLGTTSDGGPMQVLGPRPRSGNR